MYNNRPLQSNLSGLKLEYAVLQVYSRDAGQREVEESSGSMLEDETGEYQASRTTRSRRCL
jgi:hypothetical protein